MIRIRFTVEMSMDILIILCLIKRSQNYVNKVRSWYQAQGVAGQALRAVWKALSPCTLASEGHL